MYVSQGAGPGVFDSGWHHRPGWGLAQAFLILDGITDPVAPPFPRFVQGEE